MQAPTFTVKCFFCEGDENDGNLIKCQTLELDRNVRSMAEKLNDSKLLAKLAEGDMCATEAVYHKKCFTSFYNRFKKAIRCVTSEEGQESLKQYAITCVVDWIKDLLVSCFENDHVPVLEQKEVIKFYKEILHQNGASENLIETTHCTRTIQMILELITGVIVPKNNVITNNVLTPDGELGKALFQVSTQSSIDDIQVMSNAAKRIRKVLFLDKQTFNGDTSFEYQENMIPDILVQLISMIIDGGKPNRNLNEKQKKIALNIAELIKFNSIKQTRKETIKNFRHSKENEPSLPVFVGLSLSQSRNKKQITFMHEKGLSISYERIKTIRSSLAFELNEKYHELGLVYPSQLQNKTFTTSAIDNFDYNLQSSTAKESIHWTGISIFQYPNSSSNTSAVSSYRIMIPCVVVNLSPS